LIDDGERILLERRPGSGLWGGLLVPPEGEAAVVLPRLGLSARECASLPAIRHTFTHFRLTLTPIHCRVERDHKHGVGDGSHCWIALGEAADAGVPTPFRKLFRALYGKPENRPLF